ncbi:HotDog domain-containing protein [Kockovaella imperatae]|uniref:HotDog domain-containing protein n=1 Tax=Kockovaella imperatae TaxID=4999 RepID=A0A1Y1U9I3_9TREE|nr:HotDog domain-containing protein [Kockovaella imperatae]ORX34204.1 HotDog domain-containing protein [Kockovaella imperatae]
MASKLLQCSACVRHARRIRSGPLRTQFRANGSSSGSFQPATPGQQLLTLRTLDSLVTTIAKSAVNSPHHPSPFSMRALPSPWLTSSSPDLDGTVPTQPLAPLTAEEEKELMRPKHMSESYTTFDLPLKSDERLYQRYVNAQGGFRIGKLLEHLDSLAGAVAYRHCLPTYLRLSQSPDSTQAFHEASTRAGLYLATASADRLDMLGKLNRDNVKDLRFSGFVTWTGNSSMEVVVKMEGSPNTSSSSSWETIMIGRFAMVCRDSKTHKSKRIPELIVESEEEQALWNIGADHRKRLKQNSMMALDKVPPTSEEVKELHDLMLKIVDHNAKYMDGEQVVQMRDTETQTVQLMFPQDRNLHGKAFGGTLMRLAFELCFTNAALFASRPMRFLSLDEITFRLPVPIGAVLRLTSKVVNTSTPRAGEEAKVHIMVRAEVEEVDSGVSRTRGWPDARLDANQGSQVRRETNTFFFTMAVEDGKPIGRTVVPTTYSESMHYLEGKRRLELGDEMRRLYSGGI